MKDMNPMDSAVGGQQQTFAPSPSLQVSRAQCSCLCPGFGPILWRGGSSAAVGRGSGVLRVPYSTASSSIAAGGAVCLWAGDAG